MTEGVGVGDGSCVGDGEGVATGVGFLIATPLFQTSFLPDFMQVNFLSPDVDVAPTLEHLSPALTAPFADSRGAFRINRKLTTRSQAFLVRRVK